MTRSEGFLTRWSRRKRAAAGRPKPARAEPDAAPSPAEAAPPNFDPAGLPPIELIGQDADIRPFLSAQAPVALTRAALRRAWSADPAIRDFIGLSENSWDFTAPDAVPGFGSLTQEDVERMISGDRSREEPEAGGVAPAVDAPSPEPTDLPPTAAADEAASSDDRRPQIGASNDAVQRRRRRHGGALPQ